MINNHWTQAAAERGCESSAKKRGVGALPEDAHCANLVRCLSDLIDCPKCGASITLRALAATTPAAQRHRCKGG